MNRVESEAIRERALELIRLYPSLSYRTIAERLGTQTDFVGAVARRAGLVRRPSTTGKRAAKRNGRRGPAPIPGKSEQ